MVEQDAQGGSEGNRHEHAQDAGPAEARDEGDDDQDGRQPDGVPNDLGVDEVEDDVRDHEVGERDHERFEGTGGKANEYRGDGANERPEVGNQRRDPSQQTQRNRIR